MTPVSQTESAGAERREKRRELRMFLFLTVVLAPIIAVLIVAGYGFVVWIYQTFFGLPGPQSI